MKRADSLSSKTDKAARERAIKWAAAIVRAGKSPFVRRAGGS